MVPLTRGYSLHEVDESSSLIMADDTEPLAPDELQQLLELAPLPEP
jgi:hypothetical protein